MPRGNPFDTRGYGTGDAFTAATLASGSSTSTLRSIDVKGGAQQVADLAARDAIPGAALARDHVDQFRQEGMLVYVDDIGAGVSETYQLQGGITNSDWAVFTGGSPAWLNIGAATEAVSTGDLAAGIAATGGLFYDASALTLRIGTGGTGTISVPGAGTNSEQFGAGALAAGLRATAVGRLATAAGQEAVAIGDAASAPGQFGVAIGNAATTGAAFNQGVAIGHLANATGNNSVSIGPSATDGGQSSSTVIGAAASTAAGGNTVVVGSSAINAAADCTVVGTFATTTSGRAVVVGRSATAGGNAVSIGYTATASASDSIAIGYAASVAHTDSIGLGRGATSTATSQLVVGSVDAAITTVYIGEGVSSASPQVLTIQGTDGAGTDIQAGSVTFRPGAGTGAAPVPSLIFQTATIGTTGSTQQAQATRLTVNSSLATFTVPVGLQSYTVAGAGSISASPAGQMIYVSNETGGAVPAFSDGSVWRRVTDRLQIA